MDQELNIKRYISAVRRSWWFILLLTAIAGAAAYFATPTAALIFQSAATIVFEQQNDSTLSITSTGALAPGRTLVNRVALIKSPPVLRRAATKVVEGGEDASSLKIFTESRELAEGITVRSLQDSDLVVVIADAPNPDLAVRRANAVANAYIEQTTEDQTTAISRSLDMITRQLRALQLVREEGLTINSQQVSALVDDLAAIATTLGSNRRQLDQLRLSYDQPLSDFERVLNLKEQFSTVLASIKAAKGQLQLTQEQAELDTNDTNTTSRIEASLQEAVNALSRGVDQLDKAIQQTGSLPEGPQTATPVQIGNSIIDAADSVRLAGTYLDQVSDGTAAVVDPVEAIEGRVLAAATSLTLVAGNYDDALRRSQLLVNKDQLTVTKNRIQALQADLNAISSDVLDLQVEPFDVFAQRKQKLLSDKLRVLDVSLGVLVQEVQVSRNQESSPTIIGYLLTAKGLAQHSAISLSDAISRVEGLGNTGTDAGPSSIKEQLDSLSAKLTTLASVTKGLKGGSENSQSQLLIDDVHGLSASLDLLSRQVQSLRNRETDSLAYGSLFLAGDWVKQGAEALREATDALERWGEIPAVAPDPLATTKDRLYEFADDLASLTADFRDTQASGGVFHRRCPVLTTYSSERY